MSAYLGGRPCLDADQERENCLSLGYPLAPWWGAANSFVCPLGPEPGRGLLLMQRGHVVALDATIPHDLVFRDSYGNEVRLRNLTLVRSWAVTPGWRGDQQCAHWVEVADKRFLAQAGGVLNKAYNLRSAPASASYFSATENSGSPWTWSEMVADIWDAVGKLDACPGLPFTPDGAPEGFAFYATPPYAALSQVLDRLACAVKYDPLTDTFAIVRLAVADAAASAALTYHDQARLWDAEPYETARGRYPQYVRVYFGRQLTTPDATGDSPFYAVDVADPSGTATGTESGTYAVLYDDLPATYDSSGTLTNSSALASRAAERAGDYYRCARLDRLHRIYDGGYSAAGLRPGAQIQVTAWRDLSDGLETAVSCYPGLLGGPLLGRPGEQGLTPGICCDGGTGNPLAQGAMPIGTAGAPASYGGWETSGPWSYSPSVQLHSQAVSYSLYQQIANFVAMTASGAHAEAIGDGVTTTFTITHNLGTRDVVVVVYEAASDYEQVAATVKAATTNTVTVTFAVAPSTGQYRVAVLKSGSAGSGTTDHGLLTGLSDDDHAQYLLLAGRSGGQTITGGTGSAEAVVLRGTSHATPGTVDAIATSSDTNSVRAVLRVRHATSGTAAAGFGTRQTFRGPNGSGTEVDLATIDAVFTTVTAGSEASDLVLRTPRAGSMTEQARITSTGAVVLGELATPPASPAAGKRAIYLDSAGSLSLKDSSGNVSTLAGSGWTKYTRTYSDFATAGTSNTLTLATLPAGTVVHAFIIKHTASFAGGAIFGYSVDLGVTGDTTLWYTAFDVLQATGNTVLAAASGFTNLSLYRHASIDLLLTAVSGGDNLDQATQGSVDVWVQTSQVP